jgi:SAM-dependent methyltransferase
LGRFGVGFWGFLGNNFKVVSNLFFMDKQFGLIKKEFAAFDKELYDEFRFVVRDTEKGIWGTADLDNVFALFQKITLSEKTEAGKAKRFLDIGCGDGRIVLVASLFADAVGIEVDKDLVAKGNEIKEKLGLGKGGGGKAELICDDFYNHDFSQYDILFVNPDQGFNRGLEDKLLKEMKGTLYLYNNLFLPRFLKRGKTWWVGEGSSKVPVTAFTR